MDVVLGLAVLAAFVFLAARARPTTPAPRRHSGRRRATATATAAGRHPVAVIVARAGRWLWSGDRVDWGRLVPPRARRRWEAATVTGRFPRDRGEWESQRPAFGPDGPLPPPQPERPPPQRPGRPTVANRDHSGWTTLPGPSRRPGHSDRPTPPPAGGGGTPTGGDHVSRGRIPIDIDWAEWLDDPGFDQLLKAPKGIEGLDFSRAEVIVAAVVYLDKLATALSGAAEAAAEDIGRRGLSVRVKAELRQAAESLGASADHYRGAGWELVEHHPDLFHLAMSKDKDPIGAARTAR